MVNTTSAGLIGVVLLARHGDRSGIVYQDPATYNSTQGYLTPYGSVCLVLNIFCSAKFLVEPRICLGSILEADLSQPLVALLHPRH